MSQKRKYIVLLNARSGDEWDKFFNYAKYSTCNYALVDPDAYLIESYLSPSDIVDDIKNYVSFTVECFVCEITGEVTWRNTNCSYSEINSFLNN